MTASEHIQTAEARRPKTVTVRVNNHPVTFQERHATGIEIKEAAIAQGIRIERDFPLFEVKGGGKLKPVADNERVRLNEDDAFRAVAPDDNS